MSAAALPPSGGLRAAELAPRPTDGHGAGVTLALLAHGVLIAALTLGVDWRTHAPEVVAAELWAAVPQMAAPRAEPQPAPEPTPAPPPAPPPAPAPQVTQPAEADIAIERERERQRQREAEERERQQRQQREQAERQQRERQQQEAERRRQQQEQQRQARERAAEEQRLAQMREENLRRIMGQAGSATGGSGTAARDAAPSASYAGRLVAHIRRHIVFTGQVPGNPAAEVEVRASPGGEVIARRLVRSSGHPEWDEAVLRAIDRAGSIPRDTDGRVPAVLIITFRPND